MLLWEKILLLVIMVFLLRLVLKSESRDWSFMENLRTTLVDREEPLQVAEVADVAHHTERIRRVTWRMGIVGASILATMLVGCQLITWDQWVAAAIPSWVMITSVMNFRAYHIEDEHTQVLRRFFREQMAEK